MRKPTFPLQGLRKAALGLGIVLSSGFALGCGARNDKVVESAPSHQNAYRDERPVYRQGQDRVDAEIGAWGGVLTLANGARLEIPRGALEATTALSFRIAEASKIFAHRDHDGPVGPSLLIEPAMKVSGGKPIALSIPFELPSGKEGKPEFSIATEFRKDEQRMSSLGTTQTRWEFGPAELRGERLFALYEEVQGLRHQFLMSK